MTDEDTFKDFLPIDEEGKAYILQHAKKCDQLFCDKLYANVSRTSVHYYYTLCLSQGEESYDSKCEQESSETDGNVEQDFDTGVRFSSTHLSWTEDSEVEQAEECIEGDISKADVTDSANLIRVNNEEDKTELKDCEKRSAALLKKELACIQDKSADYIYKIVHAVAVLYARKLLLSLLSDWPLKDAAIGDICTSENLPHVLDLIRLMGTSELFSKAVKNVLEQWPQSGLQSAVLVACNFMKSSSSTPVVCESTDKELKTTPFKKVHIPDADFLMVTFDASCSSKDDGGELIISSSENSTADCKTFGGQKNQWINCHMPGNSLFHKYVCGVEDTNDYYKFTVTAGHLGHFDTGYLMLKSLLTMPSIISALPLNNVWRRLIRVTCQQTGQFRLKTIQLLLCFLTSQLGSTEPQSLSFDLSLLAPLWRLNEKIFNQNPSLSGPQPSLHRALAELFFTVESLAVQCDVADEYAFGLSSPAYIKKMMTRGLKNVAILSLAINHENLVTQKLKQR